MTWSFASFTYNNSLLKRIMYCLNDSSFAWWMLRRCLVGFLCRCPPMKWQTKPLLSYSKFAMVLGGILLNHILATPFSVVGKALHITSSRVIYKSIKVLNDLMWSKGSLELSNNSSWGRQNFGGRGQFYTLVVNGESVLRIILSCSPQLCPLLHSQVHPFPSLCYGARSSSWTSFLPIPSSSCWSGCLILPHWCFLWFFDVLLHSGS